MNESMGSIIIRLRKERGLTQDQLATALGISFQAVSKWENGLSCPDLSMLPLLADYFGVSIDTLFGRTEAVAPPEGSQKAPSASATGPLLPWPDDETFYAVLFHGHELIGSMEQSRGTGAAQRAFRFQYEGPAQNVCCAFDLQLDGSVAGNVSAGGDISCDGVGGGVSAEGDVNCGDVAGGVEAHGDVSCDGIGGAANAGGDINCDAIYGSVNAAGDVSCDDVYGNIEAGGDVSCGDVTGNVAAGGDVSCDDVQGSVTAGGDLSGALSGLGDAISEAVEKSVKKHWHFHKSWPFGGHQVDVELNLDEDE